MDWNTARRRQIDRIGRAAAHLDVRGLPEDLALLQVMYTDLQHRAQVQNAPSCPMRQALPAPNLIAAEPTTRATNLPFCSVCPDALRNAVAQVDWRHRHTQKHLAYAIMAASFGQDILVVAQTYQVLPEMIAGGLYVLQSEGLDGFMARLGCTRLAF